MPQELFSIISPLWEIFRAWWWLPLPFILIRPLFYFWLWWRRTLWYNNINWVLLEIKVPAEQAKTPKAMEQVLASFTAVYSGPNTRETWFDGEIDLWLSLEIVGIDGIPHFFIRCPTDKRNLIESGIYSQYPDAEIFEAEDYVENIPQGIPDGDWDFWGRTMILKKDDPYPIKTYKDFSAPQEKEEKIVDPVASLLEGIGKLKKGEQIWIQFLIRPMMGGEVGLKEEGEKLRDKLAKRSVEKKAEPKPILFEAGELLVFGPSEKKEEKKEERDLFPPEMRLTPGERDIVEAIEEKISKPPFQVVTRMMYLGHKDAYFGANASILYGFFNSFGTQNLNWIGSEGKVSTKVQWFFSKRRVYARKKRMFWLYKLKLPPFPGYSDFWSGKIGISIMNNEEIATMFHFPSRLVAPAPTMVRVESKKGEPPPELPTE